MNTCMLVACMHGRKETPGPVVSANDVQSCTRREGEEGGIETMYVCLLRHTSIESRDTGVSYVHMMGSLTCLIAAIATAGC